jgi:hypothetical protein
MQRWRKLFLWGGIGLHCLAVIVIGLLFYATGGMTGWCVIPAALIACASVPAMPGRPILLYAGFGLFVGVAFWLFISGLKQHDVITIVVALVLTVAGTWLLRDPSWPAAGFTAATLFMCLALAVGMCLQRPDYDDPIPDRGRRTGITTLGIACLASAYAGLGFSEIVVRESRARKLRKKSVACWRRSTNARVDLA